MLCLIKLNIFAPVLADTYASSTFSLMEGHFKVAFAFVRGDMEDRKIKRETDLQVCVRNEGPQVIYVYKNDHK